MLSKSKSLIVSAAAITLLMSCGSSDQRASLQRTNNDNDRLSVEPPNQSPTPLRIALESKISDSGEVKSSISIAFANEPNRRGKAYWSELLGEQFNVMIKNHRFTMELNPQASNEYDLVSYAPFESVEAFEALHSAPIQLEDLDGEALTEGSVQTPAALGRISKGYLDLSQGERILSHCEVYYPAETPPGLYWLGTGSNPIEVVLSNGIYTSDPIRVEDKQLWIPSKADLAPLIDPALREEVDRDGGFVASFSEVTMIRKKSGSLSTIKNTGIAKREIPIEAQVVEKINYYVDYYGGCDE